MMDKAGQFEGWHYCPICGRWIEADNKSDVENGRASSYVFVHDNVPHGPEDVVALRYGIN